jgi:chromosome segregation protein
MEGAQAALTEAEAAAVAAEAAHNVSRTEMETARATLAESEKRVQRLETEAKTLSKMLSLETRSLWPPVIDHISVEKGYEKALGAALGDDLDAPVDPSSPMHWSEIAHEAGDPSLPDGVAALAQYVKAPAQLGRRLSQIGVVDREAAARIAGSLKTGQRLGLTRRRSLAVGWLRCGRACANGCRPQAGAAQPVYRNRQRARKRAQRS